MDRATLEIASLDQLRKKARRYRLPSTGERSELIDAIMSHLERPAPSDLLQDMTVEKDLPQRSASASAEPLTAEVFRETMLQMQQ